MSDQGTPEDIDAAERSEAEEIRSRIADLPNALGLAARLNSGVLEAGAALDMRTTHLVRVAAMAATGMPVMGWEVNLELMEDEVGVDDIEAVLAVIAPIIGDVVKSIGPERVRAILPILRELRARLGQVEG